MYALRYEYGVAVHSSATFVRCDAYIHVTAGVVYRDMTQSTVDYGVSGSIEKGRLRRLRPAIGLYHWTTWICS